MLTCRLPTCRVQEIMEDCTPAAAALLALLIVIRMPGETSISREPDHPSADDYGYWQQLRQRDGLPTLVAEAQQHVVPRRVPGGEEAVLRSLSLPALVVTIDSDILYPPSEQEYLARAMPNARHVVVNSNNGHDGFLLEQEAISAAIVDFLSELDAQ